jgi:hypothetical protein
MAVLYIPKLLNENTGLLASNLRSQDVNNTGMDLEIVRVSKEL